MPPRGGQSHCRDQKDRQDRAAPVSKDIHIVRHKAKR